MKKTMIFAGLSVAALAAAAGIATAQTAPAQTASAQTAQGHGWARAHASRDADNDGRVSQAEFLGDRITRLTALDANGDGTVSVEEMRAGMQARRAERATARFDRLDANKDGSISRAEFDAPRAERGERAERGQGGDHMRGGRGHGRGAMHAGRGGMDRAGPGRAGAGRAGPIVIAEVQAKALERFAALDTNRDGFLSAEEQTAGRSAMRERSQAHRAERRAQREAARTANPASPSAPASE